MQLWDVGFHNRRSLTSKSANSTHEFYQNHSHDTLHVDTFYQITFNVEMTLKSCLRDGTKYKITMSNLVNVKLI